MLFSKALVGKITTSDAKLFAIRLEVSKATSIDIEHIILITSSLGSVLWTKALRVGQQNNSCIE